MLWLKLGAVAALLYYLTQKTEAGAAVVASVIRCPEGSLLGPWATCVRACPPGWTHGYKDGKGYCYGGGSISIFDPSTGEELANSTAATGVDGNTISVQTDPSAGSGGINPYTGTLYL